MRELNLVAAGRLEWFDRPDPQLFADGDAIVRPFVVSRCDGDCLPVHRNVSRVMQAGLRTGLLDPAVGGICGPVPFAGPFPIGHECVAEVVVTGIVGLVQVRKGSRAALVYGLVCGQVYLVVAALGLAGGSNVLGFMAVDAFGNWVHVVEGLLVLAPMTLLAVGGSLWGRSGR